MKNTNFSSPAGVAAFLRNYNAWRQDDSELDAPDRPAMPDPKDIGRAIAAAVRMLEGIAHAPSPCQGHARQQEAGEDSARLDFLDQNLGMFPIQMGWNVGVAPGGNVSITTVIGGQNNIRESIDFAMQSMKGAK